MSLIVWVLTLLNSGLDKKSKTQPDQETLKQYLADKNITAKNEMLFISETFLGCFRQRRLIEAALKFFFTDTGQR
jgi:hypothetical protein